MVFSIQVRCWISWTKSAGDLSCWAISNSLDSLMNTSQYTHDWPPPGTTAAYISLKLDSSIRLQQFVCMFRDKASCRVTLILREEYSLLFGWAIRQWLAHKSSFPRVHEQESVKKVHPPQQRRQDDFSPYKVLTWEYLAIDLPMFYLATCCYLLRYPQTSQTLYNPLRQHAL